MNTKTIMVVLVLGLIIGLWTYGNANNDAGEITACANRSGLIRLIGDGFRRDECRRNETAVSWNTEGEQGEKGDKGDSELFKKITLRVWVSDDTETHPLPERAEVRLPGSGAWWIKRSTRRGSAAKNLGRREVWREHQLWIYPDGREGRGIEVLFNLIPSMKPKGNDQDVLRIRITDDEVVVDGTPVGTELRFPRFKTP